MTSERGGAWAGESRPAKRGRHAVAAAKGQYGMLLWVKDRDCARAARALKAK